ncbi:MAG: L-threonylcarbamoyladenylate synthase [Rickettsiales bacterium]|jgi:L-threonylcarbamoyladenylate synthase|nr:L-threonylcarbamoyladenylate synthase [Rickettsiales bacterium]
MKTVFDADFVKKLNTHLANGGVIAFPTDTVWGLGVLPTAAGWDALFEIKNRPAERFLIIMSNTIENLAPYMYCFSDKAIELGKKFWPGALTISGNPDPIFDSGHLLPKPTRPEMLSDSRSLFGSVRIPNHPVFQELCSVVDGHCLATTSANISGHPILKSADEIRKAFPNIIIIEDGGITPAGLASTVIRVKDDDIEILRQGAVVVE